jgi:hypothetical protein
MKPRSAVEMAGRGKRRKTKLRFPSILPSPWKSPGAISTFPPRRQLVYIFFPKEQHKNQKKEPGDAPARLQPFRLIFTLENALHVLFRRSSAVSP